LAGGTQGGAACAAPARVNAAQAASNAFLINMIHSPYKSGGCRKHHGAKICRPRLNRV